MRAACAAILVAVLTVLGVTTVASADTGPVVSVGDLEDSPVVLYATIGSALTVTADVVPGTSAQPITGVHVLLTADVVRSGAINSVTADLTSSDGEHWAASVPIARTASPGHWVAVVTATDAGSAQGTADANFNVVENTHLSFTTTPGDPVVGGALTFNGTLTRMQPASDPNADGSYVRYPSEGIHVTSQPGNGQSGTTDSSGQFHITVLAGGSTGSSLWSVDFFGTIDHAPATGLKEISLQAKATGLATRFSSFDAYPEPTYFHAYTHFRGTLQHQDAHGTWLPYAGKAVTIYRHSLSLQYTTTTDSHGNFSLQVRGPSATVTGTWYALFVGTINYKATTSHGDYVPTVEPPMRITRISANPAGSDSPVTNTKLNEEYITLTNEGTHDANVDEWSVRDKAGHLYVIAGAIYIQPGHSISIHTGSGVNTTTQFYWGSSTYIWNNDGDTGYLRDTFGTTIDSYTYG